MYMFGIECFRLVELVEFWEGVEGDVVYDYIGYDFVNWWVVWYVYYWFVFDDFVDGYSFSWVRVGGLNVVI